MSTGSSLAGRGPPSAGNPFPVLSRAPAGTGLPAASPSQGQGTSHATSGTGTGLSGHPSIGGPAGLSMRPAGAVPNSNAQVARASSAPSGAPSTASGADILALLQRGSSAAAAVSNILQPLGPAAPSLPASIPASGWLGYSGANTQTAASTVDAARSSSASVTHEDGANTGGPSVEGYGLLGLLGIIRMAEREVTPVTMLATGIDFTSLNLNLSSPEPLNSGFSHPWGEVPVAKEPAFNLPACYKVPQPALKTGHFSKFDVGTLLYIFYSMPKDILQAHAAQELYNREWRYQKDMKMWFRRETPVVGGTPVYVYWDITIWEKKIYSGNVATLVAGFLTEDETRVKIPQAATVPPGVGPAPA
jgi:hypothetical protein